VDSGVIYFGAGNGCLYTLNVTTGLQLWNFTMPRLRDNGWAVESGPAVDNGKIFQGSFYGCLYAFGNAPAPTPTPTPSQTTTATPTQTPSVPPKPTP
jgi:outer membrane protein assembly factor BamB